MALIQVAGLLMLATFVFMAVVFVGKEDEEKTTDRFASPKKTRRIRARTTRPRRKAA